MKNELTILIRSKGWTLNDFLVEIGFSLRWYRTHEKVGAARYEFLCKKINELESKQ